MRYPRFTIARLLGVILICGIILAGLRLGSNEWFKSIYSLTLVYAVIAFRYRRAYWCEFAVAGWAYFVDGIGHCALTILFGFAGGLVSRALARRATTGW